jgi:hypothetical protein
MFEDNAAFRKLSRRDVHLFFAHRKTLYAVSSRAYLALIAESSVYVDYILRHALERSTITAKHVRCSIADGRLPSSVLSLRQIEHLVFSAPVINMPLSSFVARRKIFG